MPNSHLLRQELEKFKESSKEAVIDGNHKIKDVDKEYFHIEREVEKELRKIIEQVNESSSPQLVLICGNVGDGKSHLLSRLHGDIPAIMNNFQIHNDATESDDPSRTYLETLEDKFSDFKDSNILNTGNHTKSLLAINLGTLANFLHEKESNEFTQLRRFVEEKGILKQEIQDNSFDPNSSFQYINFTDYHLYSLNEDGAKSKLIKELLKRIVNPNSTENPIFRAYEKTMLQKGFSKEKCPILVNYKLLVDEPLIRVKIERLLIEVIVKYKHIISLRALLNFIYDLIVPAELASLSEESLFEKINSFNNEPEGFLNNLLINYVFEHPSVSLTYKHLAKLDPTSIRGEGLDSLIINLINAENPSQEVESFFDASIVKSIVRDYFDLKYSKRKHILEKTFIRLLFFTGNTSDQYFNDTDFDEYMDCLYAFNKSDFKKLLGLYKNVSGAIYKWNGKAGGKTTSNLINTFIGQRQNKYRISTELSLEPKPRDVHLVINENNEEDIVYKFLQYLRVAFRSKSENREIDIDYRLYLLIRKINRGYRPNQFDKSDFINFSNFIDELMSDVLGDKNLFFRESNHSTHRIFSLTHNDSFGIFKFKEIR